MKRRQFDSAEKLVVIVLMVKHVPSKDEFGVRFSVAAFLKGISFNGKTLTSHVRNVGSIPTLSKP